MRTTIKTTLIAAALIFSVYEYFRIFMVGVSWAPWKEARTFVQKDDRGSFEITFFPDGRFLTRSNSEFGACVRAGEARGTMGRRVLGQLQYVDCPFLIKFHFVPAAIEMACVEMTTIKEEGPACTPPNALARIAKTDVFYRLMGFTENGGLYDTGESLERAPNPDMKSLYSTVDRLAPINGEGEGSNGESNVPSLTSLQRPHAREEHQ